MRRRSATSTAHRNHPHYSLIHLKNVRIEQQSQLISHLNSTLMKYKHRREREEKKEKEKKEREDKNLTVTDLRSNHVESSIQRMSISNHLESHSKIKSRDLKSFPILPFTKRAVLFTMDSISSCKITFEKNTSHPTPPHFFS